MLTVSDEDEDLIAAMRLGARGYLLKSMDSRGFVSSLRALERGELAISRSAASRLIEGLLVITQGDSSGPREVLTQREIELLHLVAVGQSNKAIAQELSVSENTVKYHIRQILQKLNVQNRTEAVTAAMRLGLIQD
jgi:DNA-binding NarL/FixJ family response regulator